MKTIPLTQGYEALVDDCDYDELTQFKWFARVTYYEAYTSAYAARNGKDSYRGRLIYMHRQITGTVDAGRSIEVDHINGDGVDNQRANLRVTTHADNLRNRRGARHDSSSGVRNVMQDKRTGRYSVVITKDWCKHYFGEYSTLEEAAIVAEQARKELFS